MQERSVTVGTETHSLPNPFFVLATQNPLEMEGTYPLPEAQLDRFLFKLKVGYPDSDALHTILDRTTHYEEPEINPVLTGEEILEMRHLALDVPVARHVQDYAVRLVQSTHPEREDAPEIAQRFIRYGASPRGAQALILAAKVLAVMDGRFNVSVDDIRHVMLPALRHRLILNFEGEAEGVTTDEVLGEVAAQMRENS
jgi:MoxR-like ATPase